MKKIVVLLVVLCALIPSVVSADELWVQNYGALHVQVWSDTDWTEVEVSGGIDGNHVIDVDKAADEMWESTGNIALYAVGPGWEPEPRKAEVAAVTFDKTWVIIYADNITNWNIVESCNGYMEDVVPATFLYVEPERKSHTHWTFYVWDEMLRAFTPR